MIAKSSYEVKVIGFGVKVNLFISRKKVLVVNHVLLVGYERNAANRLMMIISTYNVKVTIIRSRVKVKLNFG